MASVTVSDGERSWDIATSEEPRTTHSIPILGMRAGMRHTVTIGLRGEVGSERAAAAVVEIETQPLSTTDFPPLAVRVSEPDKMEPGLTLLSAIRWLERGEDLVNGWLVILDAAGDVVWYYHPTPSYRRRASDLA